MADKSNDPAVMWQNFLGEIEKGFNSFANQTMGSGEFSRTMNQLTGTSVGAQKALGDVMERYLVGMNLPSRTQIENVGERLQAIEGQLNEIKTLLYQVHQNAGASEPLLPAAARPPRTKRPPSAIKGEQKLPPPRRLWTYLQFRAASSRKSSARSSAALRVSSILHRRGQHWVRPRKTFSSNAER